jgi:hypothetical protein
MPAMVALPINVVLITDCASLWHLRQEIFDTNVGVPKKQHNY